MSADLTLVVDNSVVAAFAEESRSLKTEALGLRAITDPVTYEHACEFLKGVKALRQKIDETYRPRIDQANKLHKDLLADLRKADAEPAEAERIVKDALVAYDREQERIRQEEARRRQEELRQEEEERRLMEAIELEAAAALNGDVALKAEAEALIAAPILVPTVAVAPATPKVSGISYRETWSAKVVSLIALVKYVATNPQFIGLLQANQTALNAQARSLKGQLQIPGVEAVCTRDVAAGRR